VLVVHPSLPARTVGQLVALVRSRPGQLDYGISGGGTASHLHQELLLATADVRMNHVPYKGIGQVLPNLVAGRVTQTLLGITVVTPYIQARKLVPIGVSCARRDPALREVPTLQEAGSKGFDATLLAGMMGPKGLPVDVAQRLEGLLQKIVAGAEVRRSFESLAINPRFETGHAFQAKMKAEYANRARLVRQLGIHTE
jgi:tripartite-type tricarboxylate transporter receptor subunit TctC